MKKTISILSLCFACLALGGAVTVGITALVKAEETTVTQDSQTTAWGPPTIQVSETDYTATVTMPFTVTTKGRVVTVAAQVH